MLKLLIKRCARRYLLADERGSIIAEMTRTGSLLQAHQYDAYGNPKHSSSARFRYTGQILIPGTELYYYKARVYHPKLGRFMQTDPIGYQDGMNWYAYAGNDPLNLVDPTGRSSEEANVWAKMFGFENSIEATEAGDGLVEATALAVNELDSRLSVSASGAAGVGLGVRATATVDSSTIKGEGIDFSAGLTSTAFGARASGTLNLSLIKPNENPTGLVTSTTVVGGAGVGGGLTVQWTPSFGLTLHVGVVGGVSITSEAAGIKTTSFD
ncbi:RHS repeat-associated core domain-containing protein [Pseudidiomarina sp. YC-516-91]|uniref:RHS repeat-associated core domain-containing protein n=1 Tax=Pseudidiomarina salilacus TaxID=3384452 RepID=UPI0039850F9C